MTIDCWPTSLAHIPKEDPWAHDHVIVAEIKSFDDSEHMGTRFTISALVPIADLDAVCQNLAALDPKVSTSGPWPFPPRPCDLSDELRTPLNLSERNSS